MSNVDCSFAVDDLLRALKQASERIAYLEGELQFAKQALNMVLQLADGDLLRAKLAALAAGSGASPSAVPEVATSSHAPLLMASEGPPQTSSTSSSPRVLHANYVKHASSPSSPGHGSYLQRYAVQQASTSTGAGASAGSSVSNSNAHVHSPTASDRDSNGPGSRQYDFLPPHSHGMGGSLPVAPPYVDVSAGLSTTVTSVPTLPLPPHLLAALSQLNVGHGGGFSDGGLNSSSISNDIQQHQRQHAHSSDGVSQNRPHSPVVTQRSTVSDVGGGTRQQGSPSFGPSWGLPSPTALQGMSWSGGSPSLGTSQALIYTSDQYYAHNNNISGGGGGGSSLIRNPYGRLNPSSLSQPYGPSGNGSPLAAGSGGGGAASNARHSRALSGSSSVSAQSPGLHSQAPSNAGSSLSAHSASLHGTASSSSGQTTETWSGVEGAAW